MLFLYAAADFKVVLKNGKIVDMFSLYLVSFQSAIFFYSKLFQSLSLLFSFMQKFSIRILFGDITGTQCCLIKHHGMALCLKSKLEFRPLGYSFQRQRWDASSWHSNRTSDKLVNKRDVGLNSVVQPAYSCSVRPTLDSLNKTKKVSE